MFLSTYVNKVDRKGRVSVPATFRIALSAQRFPGIVVFPSYKYPALEANSIEWMEELAARLDTLDKFSDEHENLEALFASSRELAFDPEGRIALPPDLAEHASITETVAFVGVGRSFQLWEPARYAEHAATLRERARQQGTRIPALLRVRPSGAGNETGRRVSPRTAKRRARCRRARRGMRSAHVPVMVDAAVAALAPRDDALYVDGTFGAGGYSRALLEAAHCRVVAIDRDPDAARRGRELAAGPKPAV